MKETHVRTNIMCPRCNHPTGLQLQWGQASVQCQHCAAAICVEIRVMDGIADVGETPVKNLGLSHRVEHALAGLGIDTLRQIADLAEEDLLRQRNIGECSLREIQDVLGRAGLRLRETPKRGSPVRYVAGPAPNTGGA